MTPAKKPIGKKRGRATNAFKLAKDHITLLQSAEDYEASKAKVTASLWSESLQNVTNALGDIPNVNEVKISANQNKQFSIAVKEQMHLPYKKYGYNELMNALNEEKEDKARKILAHTEAMALVDLKINLLAVLAEKRRHNSGVEADLREIYQKHINKVRDFITTDSIGHVTPSSSSKKQRK